jgi:hypothetical protein
MAGQWINCDPRAKTAKYPPKGVEVFCTLREKVAESDGRHSVVTAILVKRGVWEHSSGERVEGHDVIAWMPLPEPYSS